MVLAFKPVGKVKQIRGIANLFNNITLLSLKGALDNIYLFIFFFLAKFHLSGKNWLLIYKHKKKNSKIPSKGEEIINFC